MGRSSFQSPAGDSLSCDTARDTPRGWLRDEFQSPAGDSLSCDRKSSGQSARLWAVSIARRRFVVLRRHLRRGGGQVGDCRFQSPAGDSLSCDVTRGGHTWWPYSSFNRPQAIRCLATSRRSSAFAGEIWVSIARRRFDVFRPLRSKRSGIGR